MLNKNYKISRKGLNNVEKLDQRYIPFENLDFDYKKIINEQILSLLPHREQAKLFIRNHGKENLDVTVIFPVLMPVHSQMTYYFTNAVLGYVISRKEILCESSNVCRLNQKSFKSYSVKSVLRFNGYYNDYINTQEKEVQ